MRDYEILRKELLGDSDVAESLFRAQEALRLTQGEPSGVDRVRASGYSSGNFHNCCLIFHIINILISTTKIILFQ